MPRPVFPKVAACTPGRLGHKWQTPVGNFPRLSPPHVSALPPPSHSDLTVGRGYSPTITTWLNLSHRRPGRESWLRGQATCSCPTAPRHPEKAPREVSTSLST